ncbi:MAG: hypothetical protein QHJ82_05845, partial [Verrucomicrobiota bacterium]|nr:hypothetical protein [Verrucomicrobiota bacterium]
SAFEGFLRRLGQPRIRTRDNLRATPQSEDKTQTTCLALYRAGLKSNKVPVTLSRHEKPSERGVLERAQNSQSELSKLAAWKSSQI